MEKPPAQAGEPEADGIDFEDAGYVPPDPDEPPPTELWSTVGDVLPWGTMLLLFSWGALFALLTLRRETGDLDAYRAWGGSLTGSQWPRDGWRLLASTFLHGGAAHVFFNATSMLIFGPSVERIFTRWGFWIVYAFGGAAASCASLAWRVARHGDGAGVSIGASGAIFALGGALLVGAWRLRHRLAVGRARAMGAAMLFLIVQSLAAGMSEHGTDNAAHAGGLAAGMMLAAVIPLHERLGGARAGWRVRVPGALAVPAFREPETCST